jgi:hypothetical protein
MKIGLESTSLYYPFATIHSNDSLNKAVLYFDLIYVINPWEVMSDRSSRPEPDSYWKQAAKMDKLHQEKLVKYIYPMEFLGEYGPDISKGAIKDLEDANFREYCEGPDMPRTWTLSPLKIPDEFREYLRNASHSYEQFTNRQIGVGPDSYSHPNYNAQLVTVPFAVGEAIMLNWVLTMLKKYKLPAFADDPTHDLVFSYKIDLMMKNELTRKDLQRRGYIRDAKADMAAIEVINEWIPSLEEVDLHKILEIRDKHEDSLRSFRSKMAELATMIQGNYWDDEFKEKVRDEARPDIIQAINDLKESVKHDTTHVLRIKATAIPGAGAALGGLVSFLDGQRRHSDVINGYTYLFDVKSEIQQSRP